MPDPSTMRVIGSDAVSWTVQVSDPDGISHVDMNHGKFPYVYKLRVVPDNCPTTFQFKVPKTRRKFFRTLAFHDLAICDCPQQETETFIVSHYRIEHDEAVISSPTHERKVEQQILFDVLEIEEQKSERQRSVIIVLLVLLLIVSLLNVWAGIGPLFGG